MTTEQENKRVELYELFLEILRHARYSPDKALETAHRIQNNLDRYAINSDKVPEDSNFELGEDLLF